jgi:hypothetical protein
VSGFGGKEGKAMGNEMRTLQIGDMFCGADDDECSQCQLLTAGFDCNCFQRKEQKND